MSSIVPSDTSSQTTDNLVNTYKELRKGANAAINQVVDGATGDALSLAGNLKFGNRMQFGVKPLDALRAYLESLEAKNQLALDGNGKPGSNGETAVPAKVSEIK
jgi:hypothetical protein